MALPTTITGPSTGLGYGGPFMSSRGDVYTITKNGTTASKLSAYKASDPASSFSAIGTDPTMPGTSAALNNVAVYQVADVLHVATNGRYTSGPATVDGIFYSVFNMSTDSWTTTFETIHAPQSNSASAGVLVDIIVRSDSVIVVGYRGTIASLNAPLLYARKVSGAWTNGVTVAGAASSSNGISYFGMALGTSDRVHFIYIGDGAGNTTAVGQRTLTSDNTLQTASTPTANSVVGTNQGYLAVVSYGSKVAALLVSVTSNKGRVVEFTSGNTPTLTLQNDAFTNFGSSGPNAFLADDPNLWALYRNSSDSDMYVAESTDDGATFGAAASSLTGTVASAATISRKATTYIRNGSYVFPYVVNDNGTVKYNEYVIRSAPPTVWLRNRKYLRR